MRLAPHLNDSAQLPSHPPAPPAGPDGLSTALARSSVAVNVSSGLTHVALRLPPPKAASEEGEAFPVSVLGFDFLSCTASPLRSGAQKPQDLSVEGSADLVPSTGLTSTAFSFPPSLLKLKNWFWKKETGVCLHVAQLSVPPAWQHQGWGL